MRNIWFWQSGTKGKTKTKVRNQQVSQPFAVFWPTPSGQHGQQCQFGPPLGAAREEQGGHQ